MQKIEPAQFEDLFEHRLRQYNEDKLFIPSEEEEQETLSSNLKEANREFATARKGDSSTLQREQALQRLENGYLKYKEIITNLNTGRKFYNDLAKIVTRFRDECKNFAYQRRVEASQLESELANAMSTLNISQASSLQDQKQRQDLRFQHQRSIKAPASEPLTAPVPTRATAQQQPSPPAVKGPVQGMWNPEMGIKFAGVTTPHQQPQQQVNGGDVHNPAYPNTRNRGGKWDETQGIRFS